MMVAGTFGKNIIRRKIMKNKSFKWLRSLFLAIVLTTVTVMGLPLTGGPVTALAADKDIVVLYTNDVHCGVDDNIGYAGLALYKTVSYTHLDVYKRQGHSHPGQHLPLRDRQCRPDQCRLDRFRHLNPETGHPGLETWSRYFC